MSKLTLTVMIIVSVLGATEKTIQGKITYLTADQVYCDLGREDGVNVGDTLTVFRRNDEIGKIITTNLARQSSVCASLIPVT